MTRLGFLNRSGCGARPVNSVVSRNRAAWGQGVNVGKYHAMANVTILGGPFAIGILVVTAETVVLPAPVFWARVMLGLYILGFVLFSLAKLSLIWRGHLVTFGSARMSRGCRLCYQVGYLLMGLGVYLTIGLMVATK